MIGLGKWKGNITTPLFSGSGIVEIKDKNGNYDFSLKIENSESVPNFTVYDIAENGNTLSAKTDALFMGNKITALISVTFNGDTFEGYIKVPFFGKVPIKDGKRVE